MTSLLRRMRNKVVRMVLWPFHRIKHVLCQVITRIFDLMFDGGWLIDRLYRSRLDIRSVLLIRLDLIGDFTLWLDSAAVYREIYPDRKLVLCANRLWAELARQQPYWDEVIEVDIDRLRTDQIYSLKLMVRLHWRGFNVAIQPTFSREIVVDRLVRATGAIERIGQQGDASNLNALDKKITDGWYTRLIFAGISQSMELQKNAEFVRALGANSFRSSVGHLIFPFPKTVFFESDKAYVVICPSASWMPKAWPADKFAHLAQDLYLQQNLRIVLCGAPADHALCERIVRATKTPIDNLAGQTSLIQLLEVIAGASLVISNDSGNIHLAAALRIPSVCIVGGGHATRFLPYVVDNNQDCVLPSVALHYMDCFGCGWQCKFPIKVGDPVPCVSNIELSTVMTLCRNMLTRTPPGASPKPSYEHVQIKHDT